MKVAAQILGAWLTPVLWLSMPTMVAARGPDGLWIGLALVMAPLVALGLRPTALSDVEPESIFPVVVLLFTVGTLLWANFILAGDVAGSLGFPRWYGIALAAAGGCLMTGWPGAGRAVPALLLVAALMVAAPLADLVRAAGSGPLAAWEKVAGQPAFRFPASSAWVTRGLPLDSIGRGGSIRFDEEHRVTAPAGGQLGARTADGGRPDGRQWLLEAGQSVVFRPGDQLQSDSEVRLQFEPDKRVPGAPTSGIAWAAGRPPDWARCAGLLMTLVFGAAALCRAGPTERMSRSTVALVAAGGLGVLLWAQLWAIYSLVVSPDVLLGSVTVDRLLLVAHLREDPAAALLQWLPVLGSLASLLASSIALRGRLGLLDSTGGGEIGRDLVLWTGVFAIAGLAAVWRLDSWYLALLGIGAAGASLGSVRLASAADVRPGTAALAGSVGLVTFGALVAIDRLRPGTGGLLGAVLAYPALAAAPAALLTLRLLRAAVPSR
jgi:hypothetical protein